MIKHSGPAIERASIGGRQSLRFAPRSKLTTFPPAVPTDFTNTVVENLPAPKGKKSTKASRAKFLEPKEVAHNQFLASAHDRYQGVPEGANRHGPPGTPAKPGIRFILLRIAPRSRAAHSSRARERWPIWTTRTHAILR